MISASGYAQDVINKAYSIKTQAGCLIEYNWNQMTDLTESSVTSSGYWEMSTGIFPYKKLFPADSIIKPFRPEKAGIRYAIYGQTYTNTGSSAYPSQSFSNKYRLYYPGIESSYKYWMSKVNTNNQYLEITYPKSIYTNKVVVKFEVSHSVPTAWEVWATYVADNGAETDTKIKEGTNSDIPSFTDTVNKPGVLSLFYNGSTWVTDSSAISLSSTKRIKKLKVVLKTIPADSYVGVIELAPLWVKDISDTVELFTINKESSTNDDALPVGSVSSNSLELNLTKYNSTSMEFVPYETVSTFLVDTSKIYLYRNAKLSPYIKIIHSNGLEGSGEDKHDKIYQGHYYIDSWSASEINDISITALDGAKQLQDTLCPNLVCKDFSVVAVLRNLLDSIGFTSYNFNLKLTGSDLSDKSIITLGYWWTENTKTIWEAIQELCRDTQMTAVFDESGTLQFYTRDYLYDSGRSSAWTFRYSNDGENLANINSLNKVDLPISNQVKIIWRGVTTSEFDSDNKPLWSADATTLTASGLKSDLSASAEAGSYIEISPVSTKDTKLDDVLSYSGYLVIDDEIIEYDAVQYSYKPADSSKPNPSYVDVTSQQDILKYRGLAHPSSTALSPTGKLRIKTRGAFGTTKAAHSAEYDYASWTIREVTLK